MLRATLVTLLLAAQPALLLTLRDVALGISDAELIAIGAGLACYVLFALFSKNIQHWHFHVHELNHMVAALCCLARIDEFHVSREKGGYVSYSDVHANAFITLAPYWLPVLCIVPLGLRYVVHDSYVVWFIGLTAFAWALHFDVFLRQTRCYQSDIKEQGAVFSIISIGCLNLLALTTVLALALGEPSRAAAQFGEYGLILAQRSAGWASDSLPVVLEWARSAGVPM